MESDRREPCPLGLTDEQARKRLWVEAEVQRLEALGATRYDHQQERGFDFWVMRDPWGNEFCVLPPKFPELPAPASAMADLVATQSEMRSRPQARKGDTVAATVLHTSQVRELQEERHGS